MAWVSFLEKGQTVACMHLENRLPLSGGGGKPCTLAFLLDQGLDVNDKMISVLLMEGNVGVISLPSGGQ